MSDTTIDPLFYEDRFSDSTWKVIFLLLYSPVGIVLAIIRMCMVLQAYVAASLLRSRVSVRRFILRIVCCALGIIIEEHENERCRDESTRFLVSNHLSIFDFIPIHLLTNCQTLIYCDFPDWLLHGIGLKSIPVNTSMSVENVGLTILRSQCKTHKQPILLFPEKETTNGETGLLKFSSWWVSEIDSVQPIALNLRRPSLIDVKPSVLGSTWYSDYFWSFFVPYTVYSVRYLPTVEKKLNECDDAFAERLQSIIAEKLKVVKTNFTSLDKTEYEKRCKREKHSKASILYKHDGILKKHRELQKMAIQVSEVLPHIPRNVIFRDLEATGNVDVTLTNILEGRVKWTSSTKDLKTQHIDDAIAGPSSSQNETSTIHTKCRIMTFQERKAKLFEDARRKYKVKHKIL